MERYGNGPNTRMHFLYRDMSNYKQGAYMVVAGTFDDAAAARVEAALDRGEWLIVPQLADHLGVHVPDPREVMLDQYPESDDDHCWVELTALEATHATPSGEVTVDEVVAAFEACAAEGWNDVDPYG